MRSKKSPFCVFAFLRNVSHFLPFSALSSRRPTKEELEMTSDPKVPGADAVYLYREEKTDDNLHYHSLSTCASRC